MPSLKSNMALAALGVSAVTAWVAPVTASRIFCGTAMPIWSHMAMMSAVLEP